MGDEKFYQPYNSSSRFQELIVQDIPIEVIEPNSPKEVNGTLKKYANAERVQHTHKCSFNPGAPEFLPVRGQEHETVELQTVHHVKLPNINFVEPNCKSQEGFWEKMELRLTQPSPTPIIFNGDPARYPRFRAEFQDQVESRALLTDLEKMNYLLSRTSGKPREVIENYQGLPNSCQLALQVLKQRFGQTAMIVETLKSSVITGPRLRSGDTAALQALSDKVQSCCWAMIELNSNELDCTTNCVKYMIACEIHSRQGGEMWLSLTVKETMVRSQHLWSYQDSYQQSH